MVISRRIMYVSCMYRVCITHVSAHRISVARGCICEHRITTWYHVQYHAYIMPYHDNVSRSVSCIYHVCITKWYHVPYHVVIRYHILIRYHVVIRRASTIRARSVIRSRKIGQKKIAIYHAVSRYAYECRGRHPYHAYISIYQHMVSRLPYHI